MREITDVADVITVPGILDVFVLYLLACQLLNRVKRLQDRA